MRVVGLIVVLMLGLAGCEKGKQSPLLLAWSLQAGPAAKLQQLPEDAGVQGKPYASSTELIQDFRSAKVQLAALSLDEAIGLRQDVPDMKLFLLLDQQEGGHMTVLVARDDTLGGRRSDLLALLLAWQAAGGKGMADLRFNAEQLVGEPPALAARMDAVQRELLHRGKLQMGIDASTLIDATLLVGAVKQVEQAASAVPATAAH